MKTFPLATFTVSTPASETPSVVVTCPSSMSQLLENKVKQAIGAASVCTFLYPVDKAGSLTAAASQRVTDPNDQAAFENRLQKDLGCCLQLAWHPETRTLVIITLGSLQSACEHRIQQWLDRVVYSVARATSIPEGDYVMQCLKVRCLHVFSLFNKRVAV